MSEMLPAPRFVVVLPVKPPASGKTRLVGLPDDVRRRLAWAFALDTASACCRAAAVAQVVVATDDVAVAAAVTALGASAIPDGASGDLNETLRQTAAEARRRWPALLPVALCADLPALRPADLDAALHSAVGRVDAGDAAYVADASGRGTTTYVAGADAFDPRFGPDSSSAHDDAGAWSLPGELTSLRRDVDDLADLDEALGLGVGPRTREVVDSLGRG